MGVLELGRFIVTKSIPYSPLKNSSSLYKYLVFEVQPFDQNAIYKGEW